MLQIVLTSLMQIVYWIGGFVLFGLVIGLLNKIFYKLSGSKSKLICYVTGAIGTPVHEFSHALACVIFGHKVTEIKLFQIDEASGVLGYVTHTYNKKNVYHQIGNFFIAIAPILFGNALILLLCFLLVPSVFTSVSSAIFNIVTDTSLGFWAQVGSFFSGILHLISALFSAKCLANPLWWLFIVLAANISLHMNLSKEDVKSGVLGFIVLAVLIFVLNLIIGLISADALTSVRGYSLVFFGWCFGFMLTSVILCLLLTWIALSIRGIIKVVKASKAKKQAAAKKGAANPSNQACAALNTKTSGTKVDASATAAKPVQSAYAPTSSVYPVQTAPYNAPQNPTAAYPQGYYPPPPCPQGQPFPNAPRHGHFMPPPHGEPHHNGHRRGKKHRRDHSIFN